MKVSEAMTAQVVTATPSTTIAQVARTLAEIESGAVPVVDDGKVVGLITDRDIVVRVVAKNGSLDTQVREVMTEGAETCGENDNLADAAAAMASRQIRRPAVALRQSADPRTPGASVLDHSALRMGQSRRDEWSIPQRGFERSAVQANRRSL